MNTVRSIAKVAPCFLAFVMTCGPAKCGTQETIPVAFENIPGWQFEIEPYGWLVGVDGTVGVDGLNAGLSESFGDILEQLDMYFAAEVEARRGRWGIMADGFYADLTASGTHPELIYDSVGVEFRQFLGKLALSYRIYESPSGFVDLYAGVRYTGLNLDLAAHVNPVEASRVGSGISGRLVGEVVTKSEEIADERLKEFESALDAERDRIEQEVRTDIQDFVGSDFARNLADELVHTIRELEHFHLISPDFGQQLVAAERQHLELAEATARLEIAKLRARVDARLQVAVRKERANVRKAEKKLAKAIRKELEKYLPVSASGSEEWVDPIVGIRTQWDLSDRWFLAANGDIGGFGVSSDLTWEVQGALGYQITPMTAVEAGYRFLQTDYSGSGFAYDLDQSGCFVGLKLRF